MGFEESFIKCQVPEWEAQYFNYGALKLELKEYRRSRRRYAKQAAKGGATHSDSSDYVLFGVPSVVDTSNDDPKMVDKIDLPQISQERTKFLGLLQQDWNRVQTFYEKTLLTDWHSRHSKSAQPVEAATAAWEEMMPIWTFLAANLICLRQVLVRYRAYGQLVSTSYGESNLNMDSTEWSIQLSDVLPSYSDLPHILQDLSSESKSTLLILSGSEQSDTIHAAWQELYDLLLVSSSASPAGEDSWEFGPLLRSYFLLGTKQLGLAMEPKYLRWHGRSLKQELKQLRAWKKRYGLQEEEFDPQSQLDPANVWPLALNLISCFLFMMNNYVIEPSSAYYALALGSSEALSGIMIGAAPWFALVSSVGYSVWTNTNYKTPILFAGGLMMVGNTLYACAYSFQSMELCLLGRAIAGLGAPRVINRRYVADATPFALRTMASAAFALMTALGAAFGPGMAIVLDAMPEFEFWLPLLGKQYFNGMTGPGYFMALCWGFYSIAIFFTFQEPKRVGLVELQQREEQQAQAETAEQGGMPAPLLEAPPSPSKKLLSNEYADVVDDRTDDASDTSSVDAASNYSSQTSNSNAPGPFSCLRHVSRATAVCMSLIFMKRIALESIVGSTSVITKTRYGWSIANVGTLHLVNGMVVIPISIWAGWLSKYYQDRVLATWFIAITIVGMLFLVDISDLIDSTSSDTYNEDSIWSVDHYRYIGGSMVAFSAIEACESFVASMLSKVVSSQLAVGTFNSGLLATLVGTSGRAVGDVLITAMGLISLRNLLNLLILPGLAVMLLSLFLLRRHYHLMDV